MPKCGRPPDGQREIDANVRTRTAHVRTGNALASIAVGTSVSQPKRVAVRQTLVGRCEQRRTTVDTTSNTACLWHESLQRAMRVSIVEICKFKSSFVLRPPRQLALPTSA